MGVALQRRGQWTLLTQTTRCVFFRVAKNSSAALHQNVLLTTFTQVWWHRTMAFTASFFLLHPLFYVFSYAIGDICELLSLFTYRSSHKALPPCFQALAEAAAVQRTHLKGDARVSAALWANACNRRRNVLLRIVQCRDKHTQTYIQAYTNGLACTES